MSTILWLTLAGGFIALMVFGVRNNKRIEARKAELRSKYESWQVFIGTVPLINPSLLAVDAETRAIALGTLEGHIEARWADITRVEVESNGTSLTTTNRGSQLLGGAVGNVLLGPMGLLMGGLTGSKSTRQRVNELALKIIVEHPAAPAHRIVFFRTGGKGVKPNTTKLAEPVKQLEHFHALLLNAMRSVDRQGAAAIPAPVTSGVEYQIGKLWDLHQAGAITQSEYDSRKQHILSSGAA